MAAPPFDLDLDHLPHLGRRRDFRIGIVGAGFIVRECHLPAYRKAGFNVVAIASRTPARAARLAADFGIPRVYSHFADLCADPDVDVVDIAFPPELQLEVVRAATAHRKHLLCQKPLAWNLEEARAIVALADAAGVKLAVNQNMRYDPAMRALRTLLQRGVLGQPVLLSYSVRLRGAPQEFARGYRNMVTNLTIHEFDCWRWLFGEPARVLCSLTRFPGQEFAGEGIVTYVLEYDSGLRAVGCDDFFSWDGEPAVTFRLEATEGIARGTIGWVHHPAGAPSTLDFLTRQVPGVWFAPRWPERWFPDAFIGTMGQLLRAIEEDRTPELNGPDHLRSLRLALAAYRAADEGRAVAPDEVS